jgi:hypothetical protein
MGVFLAKQPLNATRTAAIMGSGFDAEAPPPE